MSGRIAEAASGGLRLCDQRVLTLRHFDFVIDGIRSQVKALASALDRLSGRIGALETRVEPLDTQITALEMRFEAGCLGPIAKATPDLRRRRGRYNVEGQSHSFSRRHLHGHRLVGLDAIYRWAEARGYPAQAEHILIEGMPTQRRERAAALLDLPGLNRALVDANLPLPEKVRLVMELQRLVLPLLARQRPLEPWEKAWEVEP